MKFWRGKHILVFILLWKNSHLLQSEFLNEVMCMKLWSTMQMLDVTVMKSLWLLRGWQWFHSRPPSPDSRIQRVSITVPTQPSQRNPSRQHPTVAPFSIRALLNHSPELLGVSTARTSMDKNLTMPITLSMQCTHPRTLKFSQCIPQTNFHVHTKSIWGSVLHCLR